jgi:nitroreductase
MNVEYESFLELVKKRRSIRSFKADPIPDDYIEKVIEAARWAPSGFNLQPWEFVVIKKEELRKSIVQYLKGFMAMSGPMEATRESWQGPKPPPGVTPPTGFANAPVFIIPFCDIRIRVGLPMIHRYNDESWDRTYISTMASTFLYMHLAATSLGLASQWVSAVTQPTVHCFIKQLLGIPAPLKIYDMLALGYPDLKPAPRLVRNREEMVHYDSCGENDFRTDEQVKDFIFRIRNPKASP